MTKYTRSEEGQVALVVLLLLTISLTVGLSLIARSINELRITSNAEKSSQAYAAAEAGIEEALVNDSISVGTPKELSLGDSKQARFTITNKATQGESSDVFVLPKTYGKDESTQVWLFNYNDFVNGTHSNSDFLLDPTASGNHDVRIYWGTQTETEDQKPALEATIVYARVTASGNNLSDFTITKFPFKTSTAQPNNTFPTAAPITPENINGTTFQYAANITLTRSSNVVPILMRLKLLYNDRKHALAIDPNPSGTTLTLPAQGAIVDSTGESGNVVRKLRVYQSYPTLPGIFDFVLFNGSSNPLEKN